MRCNFKFAVTLITQRSEVNELFSEKNTRAHD